MSCEAYSKAHCSHFYCLDKVVVDMIADSSTTNVIDFCTEPKSDAEAKAKAKADAEWVDAAHDFIMVMTSAFRSGFAPSESA